MLDTPQPAGCLTLVITLFETFKQNRAKPEGGKTGRPCTCSEESFVIFAVFVSRPRRYHPPRLVLRLIPTFFPRPALADAVALSRLYPVSARTHIS